MPLLQHMVSLIGLSTCPPTEKTRQCMPPVPRQSCFHLSSLLKMEGCTLPATGTGTQLRGEVPPTNGVFFAPAGAALVSPQHIVFNPVDSTLLRLIFTLHMVTCHICAINNVRKQLLAKVKVSQVNKFEVSVWIGSDTSRHLQRAVVGVGLIEIVKCSYRSGGTI